MKIKRMKMETENRKININAHAYKENIQNKISNATVILF